MNRRVYERVRNILIFSEDTVEADNLMGEMFFKLSKELKTKADWVALATAINREIVVREDVVRGGPSKELQFEELRIRLKENLMSRGD